MDEQDRATRTGDTCAAPASGNTPETRATGHDDNVTPLRPVIRPWVMETLVAAYAGDTYRLLTELADRLDATGTDHRPAAAGRHG